MPIRILGPKLYKATHEFERPEIKPSHLFDAVWNFASYPEFVTGVQAVEVLEDDGKVARAQFTAGLMGVRFQYVLLCKRTRTEVRWERESGDFQDAQGRMKSLGKGKYLYENALDPGFAVPAFAVKMVLKRGMPKLIAEFCRRAKSS